MTLVQYVPAGAVVYLECGCRGHRMAARPDASMVVVIVEQPCTEHGPDGQPLMREIDPLTLVSPFTRNP